MPTGFHKPLDQPRRFFIPVKEDHFQEIGGDGIKHQDTTESHYLLKMGDRKAQHPGQGRNR